MNERAGRVYGVDRDGARQITDVTNATTRSRDRVIEVDGEICDDRRQPGQAELGREG